uniref:Uncharacterized protein n=1 Tax=Anguilla anguilla TaxID=7936 RepID=A0A0E9R5H0_ANGAN
MSPSRRPLSDYFVCRPVGPLANFITSVTVPKAGEKSIQ